MEITREGFELNKIEFVIVIFITIITAFSLLLGYCKILMLFPEFVESFRRATGI